MNDFLCHAYLPTGVLCSQVLPDLADFADHLADHQRARDKAAAPKGSITEQVLAAEDADTFDADEKRREIDYLEHLAQTSEMGWTYRLIQEAENHDKEVAADERRIERERLQHLIDTSDMGWAYAAIKDAEDHGWRNERAELLRLIETSDMGWAYQLILDAEKADRRAYTQRYYKKNRNVILLQKKTSYQRRKEEKNRQPREGLGYTGAGVK